MTGALRPLPCAKCGCTPTVLRAMRGDHVHALHLNCGQGCLGGRLWRDYVEPESLSPREVLRRRRAGTLPDVDEAHDALVRRWNGRHRTRE